MRRALDKELVRRGLAPDLDASRELVEAGRVLVSGAVAMNPARRVDAGEPVVIRVPQRFVGRGGEKLAAALERFEIDPRAAEVLDVGASTGGFTDCLLQAGARAVTALDVGHNQLHESLRADERVTVLERTNLRNVSAEDLGPFDGVVGDLSFISLTAVMANICDLVRPGGWMVLLVKPQFEAPRAEVSKGSGVISDPELWRSAIVSVIRAAQAQRASIIDVMSSPLKGGSGNVEFLVHLRAADEFADHHDAALSEPEPATLALVDAAVGGAGTGTPEAGGDQR